MLLPFNSPLVRSQPISILVRSQAALTFFKPTGECTQLWRIPIATRQPVQLGNACLPSKDRVLTALGELAQADLVRRRGNGEFAFRDPVLGHVAHEHSSLSEQSAGHRRALDLLTKRETAVAALARHAEHLLGTDSGTAAPILVRAAAEVVARDPAAAAGATRARGLRMSGLPRSRVTLVLVILVVLVIVMWLLTR